MSWLSAISKKRLVGNYKGYGVVANKKSHGAFCAEIYNSPNDGKLIFVEGIHSTCLPRLEEVKLWAELKINELLTKTPSK